MKRSSIRLITLAALSTACLAASLFGTVQAAPAPNAKLPVVAVQAVEMLPQTVSRRLAGRVTALHRVNITARVSGEIKEVAFADGALVKKGDVLYRLDDVQYQAALQSAKAAVMQAQAESLYAERDYKRQQALYEQKASSRDVLDAAALGRECPSQLGTDQRGGDEEQYGGEENIEKHGQFFLCHHRQSPQADDGRGRHQRELPCTHATRFAQAGTAAGRGLLGICLGHIRLF